MDRVGLSCMRRYTGMLFLQMALPRMNGLPYMHSLIKVLFLPMIIFLLFLYRSSIRVEAAYRPIIGIPFRILFPFVVINFRLF